MSLVGFRAENHPQQTAKRAARDDVDDRETAPEHFDAFAAEFGPFTLDVAAAPHNAKCERFYTRDDDGLERWWTGTVWCNPPYSDIGAWVRKAWLEWNVVGLHEHLRPERIVMLLPANRTEQKWWQTWVEPYRARPDFAVRFLPGRMRFIRPNAVIGPKGDRPPFGCCLLIWDRTGLDDANPSVRAAADQPCGKQHLYALDRLGATGEDLGHATNPVGDAHLVSVGDTP